MWYANDAVAQVLHRHCDQWIAGHLNSKFEFKSRIGLREILAKQGLVISARASYFSMAAPDGGLIAMILPSNVKCMGRHENVKCPRAPK